MATLISQINSAVSKAVSNVPVPTIKAPTQKTTTNTNSGFKNPTNYKPGVTVTKYAANGAPYSAQSTKNYSSATNQTQGFITPNASSNKYNTTTGKLNPNYTGATGGSSSASLSGVSTSSQTGVSAPTNNIGAGNITLPSTNVVNTTTLTPGISNTKVTLPTPEVTKAPTIIPLAPLDQQMKDAQDKSATDFKKYLDAIAPPPSSAEAYNRAQNEAGVLQRQQTVNNLSSKLNSIVSTGEANKLSLVGQGRGIPEAIIGGQQAEIGRETAIQALPVQAQLSAAQGDLEMANQNLDTLFKIYSDDAKNQYEYKTKMNEAVYSFADKQTQAKIAGIQKLQDRQYEETKDLHTEQSMYAKMAFETGQSSLGAKIAKLDYKSPTFRDELASLSSKIVDSKRQLEIQKLQADINKINASTGGTVINPKVLNTTQFKAAQAAQNLKLTLTKAVDAVNKYGNREVVSGEGKGILDSIKVQLRSEISTALEQGVVVPGEAAAFDQIAGQLNKSFFIRNSKTLASLNSLSSSMDGRLALQKAALTNTYQVSPEQVDTLLNITNLSDQEFTDMDALIEQ